VRTFHGKRPAGWWEECAVTRAVVAGLGDLEADREVFLTDAKARLGTP